MDVFAEGLAILRRFIAEQGVVDHRDVLAVEKEFRLPVGPFEVLGFIDRVDWIDDETVEVIDYKTGGYYAPAWKGTFAQGTRLQHALYGLAALEVLRRDTPEVEVACEAAAGLSLGEYTAMVFAGVMEFEDGLKLVSRRGAALPEQPCRQGRQAAETNRSSHAHRPAQKPGSTGRCPSRHAGGHRTESLIRALHRLEMKT